MPRSLLWLALLCHVALATGYAWSTPSFEGPDENIHYEYAWQMGNAGRQPKASALVALRGEAQTEGAVLGHHPPLYYAILGAALAATDTDDTVFGPSINPEFGAPDKASRHLKFRHGSGQGDGVLFGLRLLSVLFGALTVWLVHRLGRACCPEQPRVADLAALLVACLPMFSFLHGVLNNDVLATPLATLTLLLVVRTLRSDAPNWRHGLGLGLAVGAALLTKMTTLFLLPLSGLALAVACARGDRSRRPAWLYVGGIALLVAALTTTPMLWRNYDLYGDPLGLAAHDAAFTPIPPEYRWNVFVDGFLPNVFRSVFGTFGWFSLQPPTLLVVVGAAVAALALLGLLRAAKERTGSFRPHSLWLLLAALALVFAGTAHFNWKAPQPQARLLFPAIGPAAVLLAAGLLRLVANLPHRRWFAALPPLVAIVVFFAWFRPAFAADLAAAEPWHRALVGHIVHRTAEPTIIWLDPLPSSTLMPMTLRWADREAPADTRYTLYAYDDAGRVLLATHEWSHGGIVMRNGEATLPGTLNPFLLNRDCTFVLRRVPATADEDPATLPTSPPLRLRPH